MRALFPRGHFCRRALFFFAMKEGETWGAALIRKARQGVNCTRGDEEGEALAHLRMGKTVQNSSPRAARLLIANPTSRAG